MSLQAQIESHVAQETMFDAYQERDIFFFASPTQSLLVGEGRFLSLPAAEPGALVAKIENEFHKRDGGFVIGALPFDPSRTAACLAYAPHVRWSGPRSSGLRPIPDLRALPRWQSAVDPAIDRVGFCEQVDTALSQMQMNPTLRKVVLSRAIDLVMQRPIDAANVLRNLARARAGGYLFALRLNELTQGPAKVLVGATPELLIRRRGEIVTSLPLAGSAPRSTDPSEDQCRAQALVASAKDQREHAYVVDALEASLAPLCRELRVPRQPSLVATPTMWHLGTAIEGRLLNTRLSSLALALAVHPTPAVCGHPTAQARTFLQNVEPYDRQFFTGCVGWCDQNGDGEWAVTIRCAQICGTTARAYAGVGIVEGSDPQAEFAETQAKLQTMLRALGIEVAAEECHVQ